MDGGVGVRRGGKPMALIDAELLLNLVREGATNEELAREFKVCTRTLERWRARHPEVSVVITRLRCRLVGYHRSRCRADTCPH